MNDTKRATTIDVENRVVDVTRNTKTSKDGKQYQNHWVLNFADVTDEQLLSLATRGIVIDLQRQFRDATPKQRNALVEQNVDVGQLLAATRTRTPADPRQASIDYFKSLSPDARDQAIAEANAN